MSIEKTTNGYRVRVYYYNIEKDKRVQYSSKVVATKKAAKELEANLLQELPQDKITALVVSKKNTSEKLIFNAIVEEFLKEQKSHLAKSSFKYKSGIIKRHLISFFNNYDVRLIDKNIVRSFKNYLIEKKISPTPIKMYINILSQILDFCVEYYSLPQNVMKGFKLKLKPVQKEINNFYTLDEFNHFIKYETKFIYKVLWILLFSTGLRIGEVLALTWGDINFKENEIYVKSSKSSVTKEIKELKNYEERYIEIMPNLTQLLSELKTMSNSIFIFNLTHPSISEHLKQTIKKSSCHKITLHGFRHSHASLLFNNNVPLRLISKRLGHKDINTTLKNYTHFYKNEDEEIRIFIQKMNKNILK